MGVSQHSYFRLCYPIIHTRDQVGSTTTIYVNATRSYTTSSAHAMRAREHLGFRALSIRVFACIPTDRPTCDQLLYVVIQLYHQSSSWNVSPGWLLLAYMFDLLPQLSRASPSWHTSTPVGIHRHICAFPMLFACFAKKISSAVLLRSVTTGTSQRPNS